MTQTDTSILEKSQTEAQEYPILTWKTRVTGSRNSGARDVDTSQAVLSPTTNTFGSMLGSDEVSASYSLPGEDFEMLNLRAWVRSVSLSRRLKEEGVQPPTLEARQIAGNLVTRLFKRYRLYPRRIAASAEEGVTITYRNHITATTLIFEVYNTTEIAALIDKAKSIVRSEDLNGAEDPALQQLIGSYRAVDPTETS